MSTESSPASDGTTSPTSDPAQELEPLPPAGGLRQIFVLGIVATCILLFCTLVGVIYVKWQPEPTAELVVPPGNSWLDGTTILAKGSGEKDLELDLNAKNNYGGRIILSPGQYIVQMKLEGVIVWSDRLTVKDAVSQRFQIPLLDSENRENFEKMRPSAEHQPAAQQPK